MIFDVDCIYNKKKSTRYSIGKKRLKKVEKRC